MLIATCCHTGVLLAFLFGADPDPQAIGFVLEVNGAWETTDEIPRRIRDGDRLLPGIRLRRAESVRKAPTDSITVCLYNGKTIVYRDAVTLPDKRDPSLLSRIWLAAFGHYQHGYASTISRGQDGLIDGVLALNNETVDLGCLFANVVDGSYRAELRRAEKKEASRDDAADWKFVTEPVRSISVEWDVNHPRRVNADGLKEGLYEITLFEIGSGVAEKIVGTPAWLLICNPKEAEENSKAYKEAVELTESWDANEETKISPVAKRAFLRAFLMSRRGGWKQ